MISSGQKGICSTCSHVNDVHRSETCYVKKCRKKIKVCGSTLHSVTHTDGTVENDYVGWVVCRPCPDHGRQSQEMDYSYYPVIAKDRNGNLVITQYGMNS